MVGIALKHAGLPVKQAVCLNELKDSKRDSIPGFGDLIMIDEIKKLRNSKSEADRRKCLELLVRHLKENPNDPEGWYDKAGCHDFLGEEREAEPCYRKTFELGWQKLPIEEQPSFFVGFGSTLRNNKKYEESISVLKEAIRFFPDYPALKFFLGLSAYSNRQDRLAAETLFSTCLQAAENGFDGYEKAVGWYAENLRTHPEPRDREDSLTIVPYDSNWPNLFLNISEKLESVLAGLIISIDHIGSTSVPGLASKHRIDVQVTVEKIDKELKAQLDGALVKAGFQASNWNQDHRPPGDKNPISAWSKLYIKGTHKDLDFRSNIHVRTDGNPNQIYPLLFRDYLREHKEAALAYERAKQELVRFHANDSVAYSELKDPICDLIMVDAKRWAEETKWKPRLRSEKR